MCLLVFDELLFVLLGQACEHETQHGQIDHGLTTAGQVLIVLAHATIAADPGQSALLYWLLGTSVRENHRQSNGPSLHWLQMDVQPG